jgi:hypothetical protein
MPNLPRGVLLALGALIVILLLILAYGLFFSGRGGSNTADLMDVIGQAQEVSRISTAQQPQLKDPNTAALAATATIATSSDAKQLSNYLTKNKVKIDKKRLAAITAANKSVDTQLTSAAGNNNLEEAYLSYLKTALSNYSQTLRKAYTSAQAPATKTLLKNSFDSSQTLLDSPLLKS